MVKTLRSPVLLLGGAAILVIAAIGAYVHFAQPMVGTASGDTGSTTEAVATGSQKAPALQDFTTYSYKRESVWLYANERHDPPVWKEFAADAATFVILNEGSEMMAAYAKDKDHVYLYGKVIPQADPRSFKILYNLVGASLASDLNAFYYGAVRVAVANALSYELANTTNPRSGNSIFLRRGPELYRVTFAEGSVSEPVLVPGSDAATFAPIADPHDGNRPMNDSVGGILFFKDKNQVYCNGSVLQGADPSTFRIAYDDATKRMFGMEAIAIDKDSAYTESCATTKKK